MSELIFDFALVLIDLNEVVVAEPKQPRLYKQPLKQQSGKFNDCQTNILINWFDSHKECPYPTIDEKHKLMQETGLSIRQLNDWMSNARRRKLKNIERMKAVRQKKVRKPRNKNQAGKFMKQY